MTKPRNLLMEKIEGVPMHVRGRSPRGAVLSRILILILIAALGSIDVQPAHGDSIPQEPARQLDALRTLLDEGDYQLAASRAARLVAVVDSLQGPHSLLSAQALDLLVEAHLYLGKDEETDPVAAIRRAISIKEEQLGQDDPAVAKSLRMLGILLRQRENFDEARGVMLRARDIHQNSTPVDSLALADCLTELGTLNTEIGHYPDALEYFLQDMEIARRLLAPDDPQLARKLAALSRLHLRMGDFEEAAARNLEATEIMASIDPEHPWVAYLSNSLGSIRAEMGELQLSRMAYERALPLAREKVGEESQLVASILNNLGVHYDTLRDFDRAEEYLEPCLRIMRGLFDEESSSVAVVLANLASVRQEQGRVEEAERLFLESIELLSKRLGSDHPAVGMRLEDLGWLHIESGDAARAELDFERSLAVRVKALPADNYEIAQAYHGLARSRQEQGNYTRAREDHRTARRIFERSVGAEHPYLIQPHLDEALLLAQMGESLEAARLAKRSEELSRAYVRLTSRYLSEREALEFSEGRVSGIDLLSSLAGRGVGIPETWDQLVRSRAMILDEMAGRSASLAAAGDDESLRASRALAAASRDYAGLLVQGPGDDAESYQTRLKLARDALETAERALAELSARFRRTRREQDTGVDQLLDALPDDASLVAFVRYLELPLAGVESNRAQWPAAYGVYVASPGAHEISFQRLGRASEIDGLIAAWRSQVTAPLHGPARGDAWTPAYDAAARELRRAIWDPIADFIRGAQRVFLVPDAELHLVNWATLTTEDGRYLLHAAPAIHYLSSERELLLEDAPPGDLLAMGGVDYEGNPDLGQDPGQGPQLRGERSDCPALDELRFGPLAGSAREVAEITRIWRRSSAGHDACLLQGTNASESAFYAAVDGKSVLHLATHGFALGVDCAAGPGTRGITELGELPDAEAASTASIRSRLQLSGLALAGANRRSEARAGGDDGILTAQEIATLDLSGVQWSVLSACSTGRGAIQSGEGVFGLRRAFLVAGARTLIMSLWPVEDRSAEAWMRALYEARFTDESNTMDAVREASLELLQAAMERGESTHPFYWGGFVAAGSWR